MKHVLKTLFILIFVFQGFSQQTSISGIVSDANGLPLPGAAVLNKNTKEAVNTNFEGLYKIKCSEGDLLSYAYVGYTTKELNVSDSDSIHVSLQPDVRMNEVVISAYGIKRTKEITTLYQTIRSEEVQGSTNTNVINSLSGKVSGLQTVKNKHKNDGSNIVLRGNRSISGSNEAIVVIDGKIVSPEEARKLDPQEILSTQVIKGANGTALYGRKGQHGVVLISTKTEKYSYQNLPEYSEESYDDIIENDFETVYVSPLSTFSIDVDKASYSNIRRMINNGQKIPPNAVKIEEMINYFDYDYPQPKGEHPFSINTEVAKTPWNNDTQIVRIGLQGKTFENDALPASNLTFLIDVSGSMSDTNKLPLLRSAFKLLVNQLREKDKVSIVVYAGAAGLVLPPTSGKEKEKIITALDHLNAGGSTAGGAGIELAYKIAQKNFIENGNNRIILATDGDFNVGATNDKAMEHLIEEKRKSGVYLSVLGFGYGNYKDSKLETLADKGNGNHAYIDTMQEAQKVFGKEFGGTLHTIAKDVKIQMEFNPKKIQAYRLIGYENRLLADEDFLDDAKDAGELGSGHTVTALYELIPVGVRSAYLKNVDALKYTKTATIIDDSDDLFTVKFRYKKPDGDKSIEMIHVQKDVITEASEDFRFASAVALFGMQLKQSKYDNNSNIKDVISLAENGTTNDMDGYRTEFIRLAKTNYNF